MEVYVVSSYKRSKTPPSKCGLSASTFNRIQELVWNVNSQSQPRPVEWACQGPPCCHKPPRWPWCTLSLRTTDERAERPACRRPDSNPCSATNPWGGFVRSLGCCGAQPPYQKMRTWKRAMPVLVPSLITVRAFTPTMPKSEKSTTSFSHHNETMKILHPLVSESHLIYLK